MEFYQVFCSLTQLTIRTMADDTGDLALFDNFTDEFCQMLTVETMYEFTEFVRISLGLDASLDIISEFNC